MSKLDSITIKGYKSIQNLENFKLTNLNILLGANGAGKSNFISVFKLLADIYAENLQFHVQKYGGVDALLHYGRKKTENISMEFYFGLNSYQFTLIPTVDNRLIFENEKVFFPEIFDSYTRSPKIIGKNHSESLIKSSSPLNPGLTNSTSFIKLALESLRIYHFHDTSDTAKVKQIHSVYDNLKLKTDAANLAAFLIRLKRDYPENYQQLVNTIRLVAPFFDDFVQREDEANVQLEWFEKGNSDTPFKAHVLSDGTLRFICLATLLLQPFSLMNDTVLIDEPELGLHPYALTVLASLIKRAAEKKQLIISTQSVELINHFSADDIIIVDRVNDASTFKRLDEEQLKDWLEDYSLGELWQQNILGGRPTR
ncbi:MAG: AAA family ATPase [Methylobacter sp.]